MRKLFIALLSALLCLLLSVSALAADGLSAFQETQTYQPGMFSDVKAGSWYEAGVRAVYTRGIMNGTGGKAFAPSQTITWAQAAAIAARIHAAYGGAEIAADTLADSIKLGSAGYVKDWEINGESVTLGVEKS